MVDYEYLFATTLHQKLKEKIIGGVFVRIDDKDTLYIQIKKFEGLVYKYYLDDFSKRILNGLSTDYIVYEVVKEYKKFILRHAFK